VSGADGLEAGIVKYNKASVFRGSAVCHFIHTHIYHGGELETENNCE
jgi:hypothetical protein